MKRNGIINNTIYFIAVLLIFCVLSFSAVGEDYTENNNRGDSLEIIYIANAGFCVKSAEATILFDAIFENEAPISDEILPPPPSEYDNPTGAALSALINAESPFETIDLVFVTHCDLDHFTVREIQQFLTIHTTTSVICPDQVQNLLPGTKNEYATNKEQVIPITPGPGTEQFVEIRGIQITVLGLRHTGGREEIALNGYLVNLAGFKLLHLGDAWAHINNFAPFEWLPREKVDVLFVPYWLISDNKFIQVLQNFFRARYIIVMHIRKGETNKIRNRIEKLQPAFLPSELLLFERKMDKKILK